MKKMIRLGDREKQEMELLCQELSNPDPGLSPELREFSRFLGESLRRIFL